MKTNAAAIRLRALTRTSALLLLLAGLAPPSGAFAGGWGAEDDHPPDGFAADMLAAPARTFLAREAEASWLAAAEAPALPAEALVAAPGLAAASASAPIGPIFSVTASTPGAEYAWGPGTNGQLGNNVTTNSTSPVAVNSPLTSGVSDIAGGGVHGLAIKGGAVYAWGLNSQGQIGDNSVTQRNAPVAVSGPLTSGVTAIAAGYQHSLAIKGGAAYAWGYNARGQLGNNSTTNSSIPVPITINGLTSGVTAIAGGFLHSLAIQNGAAYAWGYNGNGQLGNNSTADSSIPVPVSGLTSGVTAIAAGLFHNLAIQNGAAYAWGNNANGQLGNGTTTQSNVPVAVLGLSTGVTSIAAGNAHCLAVKNGNVFAWGANANGQLGNGTTVDASTPFQVDAAHLTNIIAVAAARFSSYALSSDGSLWVWGDNSSGQLGLGSGAAQFTTPQHLLPAAGFAYTAIDSDSASDSAYAVLSPVVVPEPATWLGGALVLGAAGLALRRRRGVRA